VDLGKFNDQQKQLGLTFLQACRGDFAQAARKSRIPENAIRFWARTERERTEAEDPFYEDDERPLPPLELIDPDGPTDSFGDPILYMRPAPEVSSWITRSFLDEASPLYNEDHWHLDGADIGVLWTNAECSKQGMRVVGTCEIPLINIKNAWEYTRAAQQYREWFSGVVPDLVITLDANFCASASDGTFCALVEHEMYHATCALDKHGCPRFDKKTGKVQYRLQGHHVNEFVPIVRRYGVGACDSAVAQMVRAANQKPLFSDVDISRCCGRCLK
jgi:Putative phage metallopeptidase